MYCSSCGSAVTKGLSYCNQCGEKLGKVKDEIADKPAELFPESLVWAIVTVFIVGLGCNIGLIAVLKEMLNLDTRLIMGFSLLVFLMMFVLEAVLLSLLLSRRKATREDLDSEQFAERSTKELVEGQSRALREHMPSVTEHTTRTFELTNVERKSE